MAGSFGTKRCDCCPQGRCCDVMIVMKYSGSAAGFVSVTFNGIGVTNPIITNHYDAIGDCGGDRVKVFTSNGNADPLGCNPYCVSTIGDLLTEFGADCFFHEEGVGPGGTLCGFDGCLCGTEATLAVQRTETSATITVEVYKGCSGICTLVATHVLAATTDEQRFDILLYGCCTCCTSNTEGELIGPTYGIDCEHCGGTCGYGDRLDWDEVGPEDPGTPVTMPASVVSVAGVGVTVSSGGSVEVRRTGTSYSADFCASAGAPTDPDAEFVLYSDGGTFTLDLTAPSGYRICAASLRVAGVGFGTASGLITATWSGGGLSETVSVTTSAFSSCSITQPEYGAAAPLGSSLTQLTIDSGDPDGTAIGTLHLCIEPLSPSDYWSP